MLFNSIAFLLFLPLVFGIYWLLGKKGIRVQNLFIVFVSYFFYGWWDWRFLSLLFISTLVDFLIGLWLGRSEPEPKRKRIILVSLVLNLGFLGFFKYYNFFIQSFSEMLAGIGYQPSIPVLNIVLPVGISFYTFQSLSYTLDVYKRKLQPTRDPVAFFAFISFFPQLVAGPIERATHLLPEFFLPRKFSYHKSVEGLREIVWGMFKKVVVADNLASFVEVVYGDPACYSGIQIWTATFLFTIQVYCDFSGYSDIALGTAKLLGFELMTNFRTPFFSQSVRELWSRWHISLSTWFRDYLFIPLGGNRRSPLRNVFNIFFTFLVSGFWHGANFTYVAWGGLHGLAYIAEEKILYFFRGKVRIFPAVRMLLVFSFFAFSLIIFRAASISDAWLMIINGVSLPEEISFDQIILFPLIDLYQPAKPVFVVFLSLGLFTFVEFMLRTRSLQDLCEAMPRPVRIIVYYFFILTIVFLGAWETPHSFIYFQF